LLELPNFRAWENFRIRGELAEELGCAVSIDSDANVAALAEALFGAEKEHAVDSLVMWALGTALGGGIIFGSQIWTGCNDMAGEISGRSATLFTLFAPAL
jgi:glucokinase